MSAMDCRDVVGCEGAAHEAPPDGSVDDGLAPVEESVSDKEGTGGAQAGAARAGPGTRLAPRVSATMAPATRGDTDNGGEASIVDAAPPGVPRSDLSARGASSEAVEPTPVS